MTPLSPPKTKLTEEYLEALASLPPMNDQDKFRYYSAFFVGAAYYRKVMIGLYGESQDDFSAGMALLDSELDAHLDRIMEGRPHAGL